MSKFTCKTLLILLCMVVFVPVGFAVAQTGYIARLYSPSTENFPAISGFLDIFDSSGNFVRGLQPGQVAVLEDKALQPLTDFKELQPGVQIVVVVNPGKPLGLRDTLGVDLFTKLAGGLKDWAGTRMTNATDDLSLIGGTDLTLMHSSDMQAWIEALDSYQPDFQNSVPSLDTLSHGLDAAADPTPRPGMKRAVLLITPVPDDATAQSALESLGDRARQEGIRVFVWLVDTPFTFESDGAKALSNLAALTGGQYFAFSGIETIPDMEHYLSQLRYVYSFTYNSRLNTSGEHQLAVQISGTGFEATSPAQTISIDVQPPNPILLSPPMQIMRAGSPDSDDPVEQYAPTQQEIKILIEFPDGHARPLQRTTLYVDKTIAAENVAPPFDRFVWDLSKYAVSQRHSLQVEAVDSLGMSRVSIDVPVQVIVQVPPTGFMATLSRSSLVLAGIAVVFAGAILAVVLLVGGRKFRLKTQTEPRYRQMDKDPVTQPVFIRAEPPSRPLSQFRQPAGVPNSALTPAAPAYLTRVREAAPNEAGSSIAITNRELLIGNDPAKATLVLKDPSVDGLHARMIHEDTGGFLLMDMGSVAGTWVNYAPISKEGIQLSHGDLIHIGRVLFRFTLSQPSQVRTPQIKTGIDDI